MINSLKNTKLFIMKKLQEQLEKIKTIIHLNEKHFQQMK